MKKLNFGGVPKEAEKPVSSKLKDIVRKYSPLIAGLALGFCLTRCAFENNSNNAKPKPAKEVKIAQNEQNETPSALINALKDEYGVVRERAAEALGEIGVNDKQFETIIKMLKNGKGEERDGAAMALGYLKDIRAIPALINALKDKDGNVRERAAWALGKIAEANPDSTEILKAVPALIDALKDKWWFVREKAAEALKKIEIRMNR